MPGSIPSSTKNQPDPDYGLFKSKLPVKKIGSCKNHVEMKIAILIRRYITTGGAERYAVEVARRLAEKHEVHVFTREWDHEPQEMELHRVSQPFKKPGYIDRWWFSWRTSQMTKGFDVVYSIETVTRFDVMSIQSRTFTSGLWGTERRTFKKNCRTWIKILTDPSVCANWLLEKIHYKIVPGRFWVAVSEMTKQNVQKSYPIPDDRFFIAPSGVDIPASNIVEKRTEWRRKLGVGAEEVLVLFVGSEFKRKGLSSLVAALGILKNRAFKLVVLGSGEPHSFKTQAVELGIDDKITWGGLVKNTSDYYAASDIYVLPTLSDPSPLSPLEAMAHGCATVMSCGQYNGAAEHIKNDEAILLEDPKNPIEIADAIKRLMNPAIREQYANKGRELVGKLTWDRTANIVIQALEQSAKERGRIK